jgi:polysaccharide deacetylase family protein (PEP-CTERM system associated)
MDAEDDRRTLLLSVDFEDWHQLVRRRAGADNWRDAGPALAGQTSATLELLDELELKATFFILGMAARSHPNLVEEIAAGGHEIACHGDEHYPVYSQTREQFGVDLDRAVGTIERLTGTRPLGYRAPAFSINKRCPWAFEVLAAEGFNYDSSEHDSPRLRSAGEILGRGARRLELGDGELWELPVAVWYTHGYRVPVGGPSYWATVPIPFVLRGLDESSPQAGLYMHPYEFDRKALNPKLPSGVPAAARLRAELRALQRNLTRRRAPLVLKAIAERHRLIPYGEAYAQLRAGAPAGS